MVTRGVRGRILSYRELWQFFWCAGSAFAEFENIKEQVNLGYTLLRLLIVVNDKLLIVNFFTGYSLNNVPGRLSTIEEIIAELVAKHL